MSFSDNEGWFWYWLYYETEKVEKNEDECDVEQSEYKRIEVTEENYDEVCGRCGRTIGEQGKTAYVKKYQGALFSLQETYICKECGWFIEF